MHTHPHPSSVANDIAKYHQLAIAHLRNPPDPRFSVLAINWYQKALRLDPTNLETHLGMAKAHHQLGQPQEALRWCQNALELGPNALATHYITCMLQLPILYQSQAEVMQRRRAYHDHLLALRQRIAAAPRAAVADLAPLVGAVTPFYLIYQGYDDVELQALYGQLICDILAARYPQWGHQQSLTLPDATEPLRIGIVFGHFHKHSVWKVVVKGWLKHLDRERFQLFGYSLGTRQDEETAIARSLLHSYVDGTRSIEEWAQRIRADQPHILLYPEVSMNRPTIQLSALRLAPIQCTTWATYVTSGLPTIDYYLSGELLEPPNAAQQHTEKLVLLPNLSIHYTPPAIMTADQGREAYRLRPSATVYLCLQSLFKYLPQHDEIYPRIAQAVGDCQFVFLRHKSSEILTRTFEQRLQKAFSAHGLDSDRHVVMLPALSDAAYHRLNQLGDLFLDSIGVAGTTTTLEAIDHNRPIVTLPGEFVRGRVSHAILQRMGVTSTIAHSIDHYIEIASRLGRSAAQRQDIEIEIAHNKQRVYKDMACVDALERAFLAFTNQAHKQQ